ncbi:MAG: alanine--glyoxylate aminotransferase family protein [Candidatus Methanomethylicia archaeon]
MDDRLLLIPGPTMVSSRVLRAMSKQVDSHLHLEFNTVLKSVVDDLKKLSESSEVFVITGSGTLAQEISIANIIEPGDKVLCFTNGFFGGRFSEIVRRHGGKPKVFEAPLGSAIKPEDVKKALKEDNFKAVTIAHIETSTAVKSPIREIGEVVAESGAYYIVDAVCSFGGVEVRTESWNIDVLCTCSQKCLAAPPGLAIIGLSRRALEYLERRETPISMFYGDLKGWLPIMRNPLDIKYWATPPINLIYALREALNQIFDEGIEKRFERHRILGEAFRKSMEALGFKLVAERGYEADTVTALYYPEGIDDVKFRNLVAERDILISPGFGPLRGKTFRVGHMGNINPNDLIAAISAIEYALLKLGFKVELGIGVKEFNESINNHYFTRQLNKKA